MKRKLLFTFFAILTVLTLVGCSFGSEQSGNGGTTGGTTGGTGDNTPKQISTIVFFDEELDGLVMPVRTEMMQIVMPVPTVKDPAAAPVSGEVVFGESDRAVTTAAKEKLNELLEADEHNDIGYIIYSDGDSVAVYWMDEDMASFAIDDFIEKCVLEYQLQVPTGVIYNENYESSEYDKNKYWLKLEKDGASDELISAYKTLYNFFDGDKLVDWVANLWDPEVGGFYYSISARDYETFLPDLESTKFAMSLLSGNGALTNKSEQLPVEMQKAMVEFVKDMQSSKDGYFYHKQWAQDKANLKVDRYGRDLASAAEFITSFYIDYDGDGVKEKQYPNWCIPGSTKCEIHTGTDERCSFPINTAYITSNSGSVTKSLDNSVASAAVSKVMSSVVTPVASSHPDYSSAEAFRNWLVSYNNGEAVKDNSGNAHNIAELRLEIIANGYLDVVLDYLDEIQAEIFEEQTEAGVTPSGAWQREANFRAVWGIYKYLAIYNVSKEQSRKIDIKYVPYLVDTCLKVIASPVGEETYHVNDVMNQWTAISRIITNVQWHYGSEEAQEIKEYVRSKVTAEHILSNLEKLRPFKVEDGSFGYSIGGRSSSTIYGVPISLGVVEGDLNSAILATNAYRTMFTALGYTAVPLFDSADLDRFVDFINTCEPIEKKPLTVESVDFEDDSDMMKLSYTHSSGDLVIGIEEDPDDSSNNALRFVSGVATGRATSVTFNTNKMGSGCNVTEFRMRVNDDTSNGWMFQIAFGTSQHYTFHRSGSEIIIKASTDYGNAKNGTEVARFNQGEWTLLRFEYYGPDEEDGRDTPITKIFINDEYVTSTEIYKGSDTGVTASSDYGSVYFYSMASVVTDVYFDDCYFTSETKTYVSED